MNLLELCGAAFLVLMAILIFVAVWLQLTGGLDLFDDEKAGSEVDRLVREADEAIANRLWNRDDVYQSKGSGS